MRTDILCIFIFCIFILTVGCVSNYNVSSYEDYHLVDICILRYEATLYIDKNLALEESYTYKILANDRYKMLYRYWKAPITYGYDINSPHIRLLNLSASSKDMVGYVVDYRGIIYIFTDNRDMYRKIKDLIYKYNVLNEVGFYNPHGYTAGTYTIEYKFLIYPPIDVDEKGYHIKLILADNHLPYSKVKINVIDKGNNILELSVSSSGLDVHKTNFGYVIEGSSPENSVIWIDMHLKPNSINGFVRYG